MAIRFFIFLPLIFVTFSCKPRHSGNTARLQDVGYMDTENIGHKFSRMVLYKKGGLFRLRICRNPEERSDWGPDYLNRNCPPDGREFYTSENLFYGSLKSNKDSFVDQKTEMSGNKDMSYQYEPGLFTPFLAQLACWDEIELKGTTTEIPRQDEKNASKYMVVYKQGNVVKFRTCSTENDPPLTKDCKTGIKEESFPYQDYLKDRAKFLKFFESNLEAANRSLASGNPIEDEIKRIEVAVNGLNNIEETLLTMQEGITFCHMPQEMQQETFDMYKPSAGVERIQ